MTALLDPEPPQAEPTQKKPTPRYRRGVMIVLLILCSLGIVVFAVTWRITGSTSLLKQIEARGGVIERAKFGQTLLRRIPGLKANSGLFNLPIRIHIATPTSDELQSLRRLTGLISIHLTEGRIDEPFCELLESLPFLSTLSVRKFDLTDENLSRMIKSIHNPARFGSLNLGNTTLTDEGLSALAKCSSLHSLWIESSDIQGSGLSHLNFRNMVQLSIQHSQIDDSGLEVIAKLQPLKLRQLQIGHNPITDSALKSLSTLATLRELDVGGTKVTPQGISELLQIIPLTSVGLNDLPWTLENLKQLPLNQSQLVQLEMAGWNFGDEDLRALPTYPKLWTLDLSRTRITDRGLPELARFPNLTNLRLEGTRVSIQGVKEILNSTKVWSLSVGKTHIKYEDLLNLLPTPSLGRIILDDMNLSTDQLQKLHRQHPRTIIQSDDRYFVAPQ